MTFRDRFRKLLGKAPVDLGRVDREVTRRPGPPASGPPPGAEGPPIEVTDEYRQVRALVEEGAPVVFVTGHAGTGKTTLVRYLVRELDRACAVVAPTGVAALNAGGATIHSFFRLPPRIPEDRDIRKHPDRELLGKLEVLIVDEVSMVRCDLLDAVDRMLRVNRERDEPFGGVSVVLVGDLFQLPPVVTEQERPVLEQRGYRSEFFFSAFALDGVPLYAVELTRVFRQADRSFVALLDRVRVGDASPGVLGALNARCVRGTRPGKAIVLATTNRLADRINEDGLAALPGAARTFEGTTTGRFDAGRERLPSPLRLRLKVGARVMFTKNDEGWRWVNGTLGEVVELEDETIGVRLHGSGKEVPVMRVSWDKYEYAWDPAQQKIVARKVGAFRQFPLMHAWAVTIHKSQGKTLDEVYVDMGHGAFAAGQTYVALSRCRRLEDVHLARPLRPGDIRCHPYVRRFYEQIAPQLEGGT